MELAAQDAVDAADQSWDPLRPGSTYYVVIGMLQQKLNHERGGNPRITVNAIFDAKTEATLKAYQGAKGLAVTGKADLPTWTALEAAAPSVMRNGELFVEDQEAAETGLSNTGNVYAELSLFSSGPGVKEVQQRVNNWLKDPVVAAKPPFSALKVDGSFGLMTRAALVKFQKAKGIKQSASTDKATWDQLDQVAGPVTTGKRVIPFLQHVEGLLTWTSGQFDWAVAGTTLFVTV